VEAVCGRVLRRIVPGPGERRRVLRLAEGLKGRVAAEAERRGLGVGVEVGGSVAKDTWLSGDVDLDVFMVFPKDFGRERLEGAALGVAEAAVEGWPWVKRFAEHPYLEAIVDGVRVNIVPCYRVRRGEWVSAADRSPFHTEYVRGRLGQRDLRGEIRLLKRFMKGTGVYGAEIRVGGFSGYLCEVLTLNYGSFVETLESASGWQRGEVVDVEGFYGGKLEEARVLFDSPLIVVDPVDRNRNAAAAVSEEKAAEFVMACRSFLEEPREALFFPPDVKPLSVNELKDALKRRGTETVFLTFVGVDAVPDVLWGQLYKSLRSIKRLMKQYGFGVVRGAVWSDEKTFNVLLIEFETSVLSRIRKHTGPQAFSSSVDRFLESHVGADDTVAGPWVEEGRWVVAVERQYRDAVSLLKDKLKDGGRSVGVASRLVKSVKGSLKILLNEEVTPTYSSNLEFAKFLSSYLVAEPSWLSGKSR